MKPDKTTFIEFIKPQIEAGFKEMAETEFEEHKKKLLDKLEAEKDKFVASTVIRLMNVVNFEDFGNRLVITVSKENK